MIGTIMMIAVILCADGIIDTLGAYGLLSLLVFSGVLTYAGCRRRRLWL